jgi:hypothetical protein
MVWLTGWGYRKSHVINYAADAGTLYQKQITVHYGSGTDSDKDVYLNSHSRTDFGDVRFTDDDGSTLLDYWMEEKVDSDYAIFWVEVADDLSTQAQVIYVYYGKSDATTTSNATNTFLFFEDFNSYSNGNLTGQGGWSGDTIFQIEDSVVFEGTKAVKVSGGTLGAKNVRKALPSGMPNSLELIARLRCGQINLHTCYVGPEAGSGNNIVNTHASVDGIWYSNGNSSGADGAYAKDIWYRIQLCIRLSNQGGKIYGTSWSAYNTPEYTGQPTYICLKTYSANAVGYYDLIILKKFVDPEPTHGSWGSQETPFVLKEVTDSLSLSDAVLRNKILEVADSLGLSDSVLRNKTFTVSDSIGLSELITLITGGILKEVLDMIGLSEQVKINKSFIIQDTVSLLDQIFRHKPSITITDAVALAEVIAVSKLFTVTDAISIADVVYAMKTLPIYDQITITDQVSTPTRILQALDAIGLSDTAYVNKTLIITDQIALAEVVEVGKGGAAKTKLFLILGDLAIQIQG